MNLATTENLKYGVNPNVMYETLHRSVNYDPHVIQHEIMSHELYETLTILVNPIIYDTPGPSVSLCGPETQGEHANQNRSLTHDEIVSQKNAETHDDIVNPRKAETLKNNVRFNDSETFKSSPTPKTLMKPKLEVGDSDNLNPFIMFRDIGTLKPYKLVRANDPLKSKPHFRIKDP